MKKIRFILVSAVLACVSFVANASERVATRFSEHESEQTIEEQNQQLLVLQPAFDFNNHASMTSHSSHRSHSSHSSHRSHYSSR